MKHKAWFRFIVKLCGLLFALIGIAILFVEGTSIAWELLTRDWMGRYPLSNYVNRDFFVGIPFTAFGAYLCFWGNWIADKAFPAGPKCCPACGYQVRGNISGICSECGSVLPPEFKVTNHE